MLLMSPAGSIGKYIRRCVNDKARAGKDATLSVATFAVGGFGLAVRAGTLPADTGPISFFRAIVPYLTAFNLSSCTLQVVASSLISWKVWTVLPHDSNSKPRSCCLIGVECASLRIIIESGVMRTACGLLLLPLVWKHNMAGVIVSAVAAQVDVSDVAFIPRLHQANESTQATASYLIIIRTDALRLGHDRRPRTPITLSDVRFDSFQVPDVCNVGALHVW